MALPGLSAVEVADCARFVLAQLRVHPETELSVRFVAAPAMAVLHERWLDEPGPTDVMSFPMDELRPGAPGAPSPPGLLGDVVLCPDVAAGQAAAAGHSTADELLLLTVHGVLHLLGYDHGTPEQEREMFALQRRLLEAHLGRVVPGVPEAREGGGVPEAREGGLSR